MACSTRYYRHNHRNPRISHDPSSSHTVGVIRLQRPLKVICLLFNSRNKELETSEGGTYSNESHTGGKRANNSRRYVTGMPPLGQDRIFNGSSLEHTSPCSTPGPHENSQEKLQQQRKMVLRKTYNAEIQYKSKTP